MISNNNLQQKSKEELISVIDSFSNTASELEEKTSNYEKIISDKDETITSLRNKIDLLTEALQLERHRRYAKKSEKTNPNQGELVFDEAELPENADEIEQVEEEIKIAAHTRTKKKGRKPLPSHLPRKQKIYDLPEDEKTCPCGCELTHIGDEKSEQLEIIPAEIFVIENIKKKYACKQCEDTVRQAKMPKQPIPKSIAGPGLLSHVLVSKFEDHLPLYRQEKQLQRIGVDIARATLSLWVIRCAELLRPLVKLMQNNIINYDIAYADETRLQVLKEPNRRADLKSFMWVFAGGPPDRFSFIYHYNISRAHDVPLEFFGGFKGYLHCDGFQAYDLMASKTDITLAGCWYHSRRKFKEAEAISKRSGLAKHAVKQIQRLSVIEKHVKTLNPIKAKLYRLEHAKPILDEFKKWLTSNKSKAPPKSLIGKAISYTLNQWPKLITYLQDGRLENNNNRTERAVKPFATGRKNWLFANSIAGANAAATIFSLIETCKHHDIKAFAWLRYVLQKIPTCTSDEELKQLLPFNFDQDFLDNAVYQIQD